MFGSTVSGLNADESKLSSIFALRVELEERKCEICWKTIFKQIHDYKFNAKWYIRHLKENTFL